MIWIPCSPSSATHTVPPPLLPPPLLQVSINDFRRLCVLKGIYPRDPPGKSSFKQKGGRQRVYYHVKDVKFLAHEPLLAKFRMMKAFMKKFKRRVGRGEEKDAERMWEARPQYTLNHLVRERYPQFGDAVRDLDDALCLIYLFAQLPAKRSIKTETTDACRKLVREWEMYVMRSGSLRKVFCSIKGTYYQARVHNEDVTWLVPHKFNIRLPRDVDFTLMGWFLDFYQVAMKFVLFRLYVGLGLRYPPRLDAEAESNDAGLRALIVEPRGEAEAPKARPAEPQFEFGDDDDTAASIAAKRAAAARADDEAARRKKNGAKEAAAGAKKTHSKRKVKSLAEKLQALPEEDAAAAAAADGARQSRPGDASELFAGLTVFVSREVPRESIELCILALGGRVGWQGPGSPVLEGDQSITHHVVDRAVMQSGQEKHSTREYVQPQWVYDSINAQLLLPVARYAMGATLPPHLSPFVDDLAEGYVPEYREELDKLKAANAENASELLLDSDDSDDAAAVDDDDAGGSEGEGEDSSSSSAKVGVSSGAASRNEHLMENQYALELAAEASGTNYSEFLKAERKKRKKQQKRANGDDGERDDDDDEDEDSDSDSDSDSDGGDVAEHVEAVEAEAAAAKRASRKKVKEAKEEEHRQRQLAVMSKKRKRLYDRMQHGIAKKQAATDTLMKKRQAAAAEKAEAEAAAAAPSASGKKRQKKKKKGGSKSR
jgi:pescadillo